MDLLVPLSFIPSLYSLNSLSQVLFVPQLGTSPSADYVTRPFPFFNFPSLFIIVPRPIVFSKFLQNLNISFRLFNYSIEFSLLHVLMRRVVDRLKSRIEIDEELMVDQKFFNRSWGAVNTECNGTEAATFSSRPDQGKWSVAEFHLKLTRAIFQFAMQRNINSLKRWTLIEYRTIFIENLYNDIDFPFLSDTPILFLLFLI